MVQVKLLAAERSLRKIMAGNSRATRQSFRIDAPFFLSLYSVALEELHRPLVPLGGGA